MMFRMVFTISAVRVWRVGRFCWVIGVSGGGGIRKFFSFGFG